MSPTNVHSGKIYLIRVLALATIASGVAEYRECILTYGGALGRAVDFLKGSHHLSSLLGLSFLMCVAVLPIAKVSTGVWLLFLRPSSRVSTIAVAMLSHLFRVLGGIVSSYICFKGAQSLQNQSFQMDLQMMLYFQRVSLLAAASINLLDVGVLSTPFVRTAMSNALVVRKRRWVEPAFVSGVIVISLAALGVAHLRWGRLALAQENQRMWDHIQSVRPAGTGSLWRELEETARRLQEKARGGDVAAMYSVAEMYLTGQGVDADSEQAIQWLSQAASENSLQAMQRLAKIHLNGEGVPYDNVEGVYWQMKAARAGDPAAKTFLEIAALSWYSNAVIVARDRLAREDRAQAPESRRGGSAR